ncbi:hypothetical protein NMY22_g2727 [Coprinellus aureogranulatus]|nr:hypothetical protein NMY22_g2727 [Coprinellus aureogranulatus]
MSRPLHNIPPTLRRAAKRTSPPPLEHSTRNPHPPPEDYGSRRQQSPRYECDFLRASSSLPSRIQSRSPSPEQVEDCGFPQHTMNSDRSLEDLYNNYVQRHTARAELRVEQPSLQHLPSVSSTSSPINSNPVTMCQISEGAPPVDATGMRDLAILPCPTRSCICPSNYDPVDICWTKEDYWRNPDVKTKKTSHSQPNMYIAIRIPGTKDHISAQQYDDIRSIAMNIARTKLVPLPEPKRTLPVRGKGRNFHWYQVHHPVAFRDAKAELESAEPLLTYSAGGWKAEYLLADVLRTLLAEKGPGSGSKGDRSTCPQRKKRSRQAASSSRKRLKPVISTSTSPSST